MCFYTSDHESYTIMLLSIVATTYFDEHLLYTKHRGEATVECAIFPG